MHKLLFYFGLFCLVSTGLAEDNGKKVINGSSAGNEIKVDLSKTSIFGSSYLNSGSIQSAAPSVFSPSFNTNFGSGLGLKMQPLIPSSNFNFNFNNYSNYTFSPLSIGGSCNSPFALNYQPTLTSFLYNLSDISANGSCNLIKTNDKELGLRFTPKYCANYSSCVGTIKDQSNSLAMIGIIKDEYTNYMLQDKIYEMETFEKLNAFAVAKYKDKINLSCKAARFHYNPTAAHSTTNCDPEDLDRVFLSIQDTCAKENKINNGCYVDKKVEGKDFKAFYDSKDKNKKDSALVSYFVKKVSTEVQSSLGRDQNNLSEIAAIINKTESEDKKMADILNLLKTMSRENRLDPILGFEKGYFDQTNFKETAIYKNIKALINAPRNRAQQPDSNEIIEELDKMRMELVKDYNNKSCDHVKTFNYICTNANALSSGTQKVDSFFSMNLDPYFPKKNDNYIKNSSFLMADNNQKENFFIMLESLRCQAFGFGKDSSTNQSLFGGSSSSGNTGLTSILYKNPAPTYDLNSDLPGTNSSFDKYASLKSVDKLNNSEGENWTKPFDKMKLIEKEGSPSVEISPGAEAARVSEESHSQIGSTLSSTTSTFSQNSMLPGSNNAISNTSNSLNSNFSNQVEAVEEKSPVAPKSNELSDKVDSLSKKLSDSEARIEKMNKENEERARNQQFQNQQQDYDDEISSLNSKISNLQKENNILQAQNKKPSIDSQDNQDFERDEENRNSNQSAKPIISSSTGNTEESQNRHKDESSTEIASAGGSASASSSSSGAGGSFSSNSSSDSGTSSLGKSSSGSSVYGTGSAASRGAGITLTRIDDMSADKAEETIIALIETNNGKPFTVEEGGFVKEIIPLVVDGKVQLDSKTGKPVYQKVTKGKVADLKNNSANKVSNTSQPINSKADLIKVEEERLKRERVEYLKLKKQALKALSPASN